MEHVRRQVSTEAELRELIAEPIDRVRDKVRTELTDVHRCFLAAARLYFVATSDAQGNLDVSPKGDPEGGVLVLDDRTVALPDRPGNRRVDGLKNLLQDPHIAVEFVIPGRGDTLRINGTATVLADAEYAPLMAVQGKPPVMIIEVAIDEVFFHCSKAFLRSQAWDPRSWPTEDDDHGVPRRAVIAKKLERPDDSLAELDRYYGAGYGKELY
ncbi:Pyridoxamine 5'-phosphate oxidase-related FMN-binding protein OS=Tsukamurella paurometabola (strain ATCC 8368 / DSM / CCUG 35730 / CIP 100753 / JCM 10117/ KCTC 9821 / NBRC 16120 / NCIMB 702349 / NCTC 13040) OX=521096 GN=Tpau_0792 PE=4 SV=1 [Tsukamurella paurometabola]|uniref:Pyridoxamine 5'-phosphate oxidase-related FMN-binding protein n=1 Tax=Tsukamurella paurometabola (strain ATCC 8368 / DSM 20162 / CCUG 35730 / CIP 100753 / JCM 10117 / KCTC 9821 / NBRC 16120 / NCIMB 702349 / NCTC 13040) TaxID=521096 RepID=D5UTS4_TSUPD|nr:MSMEG_1061 family FMN-dependent PPOX-type flavoprotein [Tsukamurella paurometabola]ADG77428.1 pyridoxamine 5'-phosphate oxidase-related FMN- binding protein [Tsukamurella paurometabola DSM 20162]SUP27005.1 pyridoxamine 5'-phosphate oxidase, FMN-binding family [Tsukamurella paurometabola]